MTFRYRHACKVFNFKKVLLPIKTAVSLTNMCQKPYKLTLDEATRLTFDR